LKKKKKQLISETSLIPLSAHGSIPAIRHSAQNLSRYPQTISRLVGPLLLWSIRCIGKQRDELQAGDGFDGASYETETRRSMRDRLTVNAKDLMVFAGLIKLRLGNSVFESIVNGCAEVGVY
jgi:nuclear pore complex protein Nup93